MSQTRDENSIRFSWNSDAGDVTAVTTRDSRTPSLVSFVGQSGAGKSTLITLLSAFKSGADRGIINTPVVGMTGKDVPTSEDVHLYPDPASVRSP
jgi:ABC-type transport system involved in cytochrome bd biosynthesis fused ATPase/permease subunit